MEYSQIAFVVSKKVAKSAVIRNTLRRRVSAIVEQNFASIKYPVKAIILIRKDFSTIKPADLQIEVEGLIKGILAWKEYWSNQLSYTKEPYHPIMGPEKLIIPMDTVVITRHVVNIQSLL